ncbi:MAG: nuclear transport factor 2 family protein [Gemmatimonadales bacterium]
MRLFLIPIYLMASAAAQTSNDEAAIIAGHENARKAHLTGNADLLAADIADRFVEAGRGTVTEMTREQVHHGFTEYFKVAKYSVWRDTYPPKVRISADGRMAWMIVAVHAELTVRDEQSGKAEPRTFDSSWISTLEKFDGAWKMVGISSSVRNN